MKEKGYTFPVGAVSDAEWEAAMLKQLESAKQP
jgi:hypothetical protein